MTKSRGSALRLRRSFWTLLIAAGLLPDAGRGVDCQSQCSMRCAGYSEGTAKQNCLNNCLYFDCPKQNANQWGAIAYSVSDQRAGWAYRQPDRGTAENTALRYCRQEGGRDCRVITSFSNGLCGSVAADGNLWGWGTAGSPNAAQQRSLRECANQGGRNCTVEAWVCSANDRSSSGSNAERTAPPKAVAWGAIAYSPRDFGAGWAQGKDDRSGAEREAMAKCETRGKGCVVRTVFNKQCGALAADGAITGVASAPDLNQARQKAIEECRRAGGAHCALHIGFCSF